jgi:mannose-6-phosphate isomerase-like protein (cupin superfamily)
MTRLEGHVEKGWGNEFIFATNEHYCGKLLNFNTDSKFSMHFHEEKDETWLVLSGKFLVKYIDLADASQHEVELLPGNVWRNKPLFPHQLICVEEGSIIEVSTADSVEDNYRILPGDSQNKI